MLFFVLVNVYIILLVFEVMGRRGFGVARFYLLSSFFAVSRFFSAAKISGMHRYGGGGAGTFFHKLSLGAANNPNGMSWPSKNFVSLRLFIDDAIIIFSFSHRYYTIGFVQLQGGGTKKNEHFSIFSREAET